MSIRNFGMMAIGLLAACAATPPSVQVSTDPGAGLDRFHTFAFVQDDAKDAGAITDKLVRQRLQYLIATHLGKRGYVPAAPGQAADLGVHYLGQVESAQRELMTGYPGPNGYGRGNVDLGGYSRMDYRRGTLIVDLFDRARKQLLWRATISEALTAGYSEENWTKVDRALDEAFKELPKPR